MVERGSGDVRAVARSVRVRVSTRLMGGVDVRLSSPAGPDACGWCASSGWSGPCATTRKLSINVCPLTLPEAIFLFSTPPKIVKLNFPYCDLKNYLCKL